MLDNLTRGRIIAGFVRGIGAEYHAHRHQSGLFAGAVCRGARSDRARLDRARAVRLFGQALSVPLRQSVAAALSDAASADLDSVARLRLDHPLGGEHALHLLPDLEPDRRGGALLPALSRRGGEGRLPGLARSARLVEHHLCRRDRQEGGARGKAASRSAGQLFPQNADRDAVAAGLHRHRLDEARARRQGHRQDGSRSKT